MPSTTRKICIVFVLMTTVKESYAESAVLAPGKRCVGSVLDGFYRITRSVFGDLSSLCAPLT